MDQIFIGRQAIYDRAGNLYGYELFYRADELNEAAFSEGHLASSHVILTTFLDIGLERLVGSNHAFINLTRDFIDGTIKLPLIPRQVVLELVEALPVTDALIAGLRHLVERGFTIALDSTLLSTGNESLLALTHIVKIDSRAYSNEDLQTLCTQLHDYPVKLLVEKIESEERYRFCQSLGVDYYQGFHLHHPEVISGKRLPTNDRIIQQLLERLQAPQVDHDAIARLIALDAALFYQLLRYLNCASYEMREVIDTAPQAIRRLGLTELQHWLKLIDMKPLSHRQPRDLLSLGLVRARMCQCMAQHAPEVCREQAFTVGQLSVLESLLQVPLATLLDDVPLSLPVKLAVLEQHGTLGALLAHSAAFEMADATPREAQADQCYLDALAWANEQLEGIHS